MCVCVRERESDVDVDDSSFPFWYVIDVSVWRMLLHRCEETDYEMDVKTHHKEEKVFDGTPKFD